MCMCHAVHQLRVLLIVGAGWLVFWLLWKATSSLLIAGAATGGAMGLLSFLIPVASHFIGVAIERRERQRRERWMPRATARRAESPKG